MKIIKVLVGIWLIISPWVLGFSETSSATWSAVISGVILLIVLFASGAPMKSSLK
jgi:hypothetical protein